MIKREHYVVIKNISTDSIVSIEARCDTITNANLFMQENEYLINSMNRLFKQPVYKFALQDVVIIEGK